ncbi:hypothetical protein [Phytomonospora endophytica]|uniref:Uncharacterized protein n=1 Tax=Phytomonospora endophytica TaxID=714109 RepID=A0A841FLZ2_9ACTN|nr:hypothetical protein [Phytomonospora endophytica]MBB6038341.1 hypothetical protein [Phytomonospora endophytica]GIG64271.1 hypothetical protein Pen01_05660 [Phytomonospora endophytica]
MAIYSRQTEFTEPVECDAATYERLVEAEGESTTELTALARELGLEPPDEHRWSLLMEFGVDGTERLVWHRTEETPLTPEEIEEEHRKHPDMPRDVRDQ